MRAREIEKFRSCRKVKIYFEDNERKGITNYIVGFIEQSDSQWEEESSYSTLVQTRYGRFAIPNRAILNVEEYIDD